MSLADSADARNKVFLSLALGGASAGLLVAALRRFEEPQAAPGLAWWLYLGALLALLLAFRPWRGAPGAAPPVSRREWVGLAAVVLVASAFRLHHITTTPYGVWFDEAQNAIESQRILNEPGYRPVFVSGLSQMPALAFYYYAAFLKLFGPDVLALRLASTVLGLAAVVAVWWLGRELFGRWEGLMAAAFLAACRWHVGFSRFAVAQVFVTVVSPVVLCLFFRSQARRSPGAAVLCGLALGIGLQLYYALSALPLVLALTALCGVAGGSFRPRPAAGLLVLTLGAAAFADAPVLQYARRHADAYAQRFKDTSIVKAGSMRELLGVLVNPSPQRAAAWASIRSSAIKHAGMFHVTGDPNGRHNLPGAPMLDPVTGFFFALGLVWCAARPLDPRRAALLLWLGAMLAGGILSLEFEAPQAARTLGATTVACLMAALPLARLRAALDVRPGPPTGRIAAALLLGAAAAFSWRTYFGRQAWDAAAFAAWSTPETKIAQTVRDEGAGKDVYVPAQWLGGPTETFILGHPLEGRVFERGRDMPLKPEGRDALVFFAGHETETAALLRRYYPAVRLEPFGPPRPDGSRADPILWIARVPAAQIAALAGWLVDFPGDASEPRAVPASAWTWDQAPVRPPFAARVRGTLRISRDGLHRIVLDTSTPATLSLDGERLLAGTGRREAAALLARGNHALALDVDVRQPGAATALLWATPGDDRETPVPSDRMYSPLLPSGGLLGCYYAGTEWAGEPVIRQIDPEVAFYFHLLPLPRPFSVRWTGSVYAPLAGSYTFSTSSVDASAVTVAGRTVVENRLRNADVEGSIVLEKGWHPIEVRYQAEHDYSQVYLHWVTPGGGRKLVPQDALRPPGPSGPVARSAPAPDLAREVPGAEGRAISVVQVRPLRSAGALRLAGAEGGRVLVLVRGGIDSFSASDLAPGPTAVLGSGAREPTDVEAGPDGRTYVLDSSGAIQVLTPRYTLERTIDLRPLAVYNPRGLALGRSGELLLADTGGGRVLVCDKEGHLLRQVGRLGKGAGELVDPMDVAEDGSGSLVVVDAGNGRIQRFAPDGRAVAAWPRPAAGLLSSRLDTDADGAVWVAGGESEEVWRLDRAGHLDVFGAGLRVVALSARPRGKLFLLAQSPDRLLAADLPSAR